MISAVLSLPAVPLAHAVAQAATQDIRLSGQVVDEAGHGLKGATLSLDLPGPKRVVQVVSDADGRFKFAGLQPGAYVLTATFESSRGESLPVTVSQAEQGQVRIVLHRSTVPVKPEAASAQAAGSDFAFSDKPNFSVAGVTDWTAVGGHGSDATLRTSEDLNRETLALQARTLTGVAAHAIEKTDSAVTESQLQKAVAADPRSYPANHDLGMFYLTAGKFPEAIGPLKGAYEGHGALPQDAYDLALAYRGSGDTARARAVVQAALRQKPTADLHRLNGELAEGAGDPVLAVQEAEAAVRMDPSEQNYLAWGSELLLHRAIWQASQVFAAGDREHPRSSRLKTAWGASLFSEALYEKAAETLCQASDLDPAYREPYLFMGKAALASPVPLPCVQTRLASFLRERPADAEANYFYAMVLLKQVSPADTEHAEPLLQKAATLDPKLTDAHLQLGVLAFQRRDYPAAVAHLTKAVESDPNQGEAHYRLGVIYDRQGDKTKAQQEFRLHDAIDAANAARVEQQRREIKQFLVVTTPVSSPQAR